MNGPISVRTYLKKATSRAKSDVANKMVSMFLHEVSRRIALELNLRVNDLEYANQVEHHFGANCALCGRALEKDRLAVEHLEGMNKVRLGLHIPGNVVLACKECNREKRRDDQAKQLVLAETGWGSFLSHDGTRCELSCSSCDYWRSVWPDNDERARMLLLARGRIVSFQDNFQSFTSKAMSLKDVIRRDVESLYRECQNFATTRIAQVSRELLESGS